MRKKEQIYADDDEDVPDENPIYPEEEKPGK